MNTGRHYIAACGTQTSGLITTGNIASGPPYVTDATEEYNGATWSNGGDNPVSVRGAGMSGTQTAGLFFGGSVDPGANTTTSVYNGTAFATNPSISTSRWLIGGSKQGSSTSAWMAGGALESPGAVSALTEEFTGDTTSANTVDITTAE